MGTSNFSDDFNQDAVAQITERLSGCGSWTNRKFDARIVP